MIENFFLFIVHNFDHLIFIMARGKQSTRKTRKTEKVHQLIALAIATIPPVVHQEKKKTTVIDMKYVNAMMDFNDSDKVEAIIGLDVGKDKVKDNMIIDSDESNLCIPDVN